MLFAEANPLWCQDLWHSIKPELFLIFWIIFFLLLFLQYFSLQCVSCIVLLSCGLFLQLSVIHLLRNIIMLKWLQGCLWWPHYYPCRIKKRPSKVLPSEHASLLTPMSAFGLRNRYLSRLGAQVCTRIIGSLFNNSDATSAFRWSSFKRQFCFFICGVFPSRFLFLFPLCSQLPDHCSTHLSSLAHRSVLKWCLSCIDLLQNCTVTVILDMYALK